MVFLLPLKIVRSIFLLLYFVCASRPLSSPICSQTNQNLGKMASAHPSQRTSDLPRRRAAINALSKIKDLCSRNVRPKKNNYSASGFSHVQQEAILPIEVIGGVLSRLPPKHLIRLQIVCKEWKSLIFGHYFMERYKDCSANVHYWYNVACDPLEAKFEQEKPTLICGFDGLLLLRSRKLKYSLWNPATHLILELPNPNHENNGNCVLTYVPATRNYRLVSVYMDKKSGEEGCEVLTPGLSMAWRPLEFPAAVYPDEGHKKREKGSIVLSGATVHYIRVLGSGKEVVSLEVGTECFTVTSLPKGKFSDWKKVRAIDWEGKLAFAEKEGVNLHVLVLENYKRTKWGEKMKINLLPLIKKEKVGEGDVLVPLFAKEGDLWIWLEGKKILTFTIKTGLVTDVQRVLFRANAEKFYPYKPTLVTFDGMKLDTQFENLRPYALN